MKQWLYFLVDEDGKSYAMQNGVLKKVSQKTPLTYTPDGWQDISIGWERDLQKIGIVRNFSIPLGFVMDGSEILRNIFYKSNVEAKVFLIIAKLETQVDTTLQTYRHHYKFFYKGELDLSTFKDELTKVTVRIMEGGLYKQLKANEGTVYEFGMDEPECILVKMDGIFLYEKKNFLILAGNTLDNICIRAQYINGEGGASGVAASSQINAPLSDTNYFLYTTQVVNDIRVTGIAKILADPITLSGTANLRLKKADGTTVLTVYSEAVTGDQVKEVAFDFTFDSEEGQAYCLTSDADGGTMVRFEESTFSVSYKSRYRETYAKAYKPLDLYKKLGSKITGNANNVSSFLLQENELFVLASGDSMRSLPNAKIKTKLNDFFEDSKVRYGAGMGIENKKIVIEPYPHFLDESDPIYLGNAKDLNINIATDLMANTLKIGYNEKSIDDVNGKFGFANGSHLYTSPITRIVFLQLF